MRKTSIFTSCACASYHPSFFFPIDSLHSIVTKFLFVDNEGPDHIVDAQGDLSLRCPHMFEDQFPHFATQIGPCQGTWYALFDSIEYSIRIFSGRGSNYKWYASTEKDIELAQNVHIQTILYKRKVSSGHLLAIHIQ